MFGDFDKFEIRLKHVNADVKTIEQIDEINFCCRESLLTEVLAKMKYLI